MLTVQTSADVVSFLLNTLFQRQGTVSLNLASTLTQWVTCVAHASAHFNVIGSSKREVGKGAKM